MRNFLWLCRKSTKQGELRSTSDETHPALCGKFFPLTARVAAVLLPALFIASSALAPRGAAPRSYLGFDRNVYPGDAALPILRKTFAFSSYWLSPPPGEKTNTWQGKRNQLLSHGFGFVVLYSGPDGRKLKNETAAKEKGTQDARAAAAAAKVEGFRDGTIIFLDIEEGGRLPPNYHAYLRAWTEELHFAGYRAGIYCSGMPVKEGSSATITTADDIRDHALSRDIAIWAYNDACPPSPGCAFARNPQAPAQSGIPYARIWQFAQSPRRKDFTARCAATYHTDGNCYGPGDTVHSWFLDINSANSTDPSHGK